MKAKKFKSMIVGITGGIATGKSTVTKLIRKKRFPVICADEISRDLTKRDGAAYKKIVKQFGTEILTKNKTLNRQHLANLVFTNKAKKKKLESIIHPLVRNEIFSQIKKLEKKHSIIFLDIPLLFESGWEKLCNATICIYANQKTQIERLKNDRGMTATHARDRIRSQLPLIEKKKRADHVINNNGTLASLKISLNSLLKSL